MLCTVPFVDQEDIWHLSTRHVCEKSDAVTIVCMHNRVSFTRSVARDKHHNPNLSMQGRKAEQE
jgi:hypothetical protein